MGPALIARSLSSRIRNLPEYPGAHPRVDWGRSGNKKKRKKKKRLLCCQHRPGERTRMGPITISSHGSSPRVSFGGDARDEVARLPALPASAPFVFFFFFFFCLSFFNVYIIIIFIYIISTHHYFIPTFFLPPKSRSPHFRPGKDLADLAVKLPNRTDEIKLVN